jgi:hypothetical protein
MSSLTHQVQLLEDLIQKLYLKVEVLKKSQTENTFEIQQLKDKVLQLNKKNFELSASNDKLKITNTLLGSTDNTRDTKLKINALIKEIDACIAYMAE